jgi:RNA polymerase sigma factor for flagellar operon FliA
MMTPNAMYTRVPTCAGLGAEHVDLVKRIAYRLHSRLPDCVQMEDLIQAGMLGLLEAQERYRSNEGAAFATFASIRIRGAMLDEIRRGDWAPRSLHRATRAIQQAQQRVEHRAGRSASEAELVAEMGLSMDQYRKTVSDGAGVHLMSLDDGDLDMPVREVPAGDASRPAELVEQADLYAAVATASARLPEREQRLMAWYYDEDLNLRQIAERLGVSESRACQLHGRALARVRKLLAGWTSPN